MTRPYVGESVTPSREESSCVLTLKDNTLQIECSFKLLPNKNYIVTNVCLLLFELGKVTYGHPCRINTTLRNFR